MLKTNTPCSTHSFPSYNTFGFLLMSFLSFVIVSCHTDDFKDFDDATVLQEGAYAFPVGTLDFTLADILSDDTTLTIGDDNGIGLIYREDNFFSLTASEILDDLTGSIDESFLHSTKIGSVAIDDVAQSSPVLFGSLLDDFNNLVVATYIQQNDGTMATVPTFEEAINSEEYIPAFNDFTSMDIEEGSLFLTITNNFFFDIEDFSVEIFDVGNNQSIGVFNFDYISVGESKTSEIQLDGKDISNEFKVNISTLKTPGTGLTPVLIDLDAKLDILFEVKNISISEGVINLPVGVLTEDEFSFEFTTENGEQIKSIQLDNAQFNYEINSDLATDVLVKITFPEVVRNNMPVTQEFMVSPTATSGPIKGSMDFSNTLWSLDKDPAQPYNRFRAIYEVSIPDGSNSQLAFSSEDEVSFLFTMNELEVSEAVGYFGFREEQFVGNTFDLGFDFSLFADESSPLLFSDPAMRLKITNSFGIPLQGEFSAKAFGFFGEEADLNPPKIIINHPTMTEIGQSVNTTFVMNKNNSDIVEMLSVFPSNIEYLGSATINPNSDPSIVNFVRSDSRLDASMEFDLPFKFSAQNLVYRDTAKSVDFVLDHAGYTIDDIESAELKFVYDNGLPLASSINLYTLDASGKETLIIQDVQFEPASVDSNGRVSANGATHGETLISLTSEQILQMNGAFRYIFEIRLSSGNGQEPVAMYSDYRVKMGVGVLIEVKKE